MAPVAPVAQRAGLWRGQWVFQRELRTPKLTTASALVLEERPRKLPSFHTTCHYRKIEPHTFQSDFHLPPKARKFCHEVRG